MAVLLEAQDAEKSVCGPCSDCRPRSRLSWDPSVLRLLPLSRDARAPRALHVQVVGAIYRPWQLNLDVVEPCGRRMLLVRYIRGPIGYVFSRLFRTSHR